VWAFGCVLYEMLTARRAFDGEDVSDTLAAVLRSEPAWGALPDDVPPAVVELITRSLEKDRRRRIADVAAALFVLAGPSPVSRVTRTERANAVTRHPIAAIVAALLVTAAAVRLAGLFRTLFFVPVVTSLVAVAVVWRYLYHPRFGLLNYGLGLLGIAPHDWLGDPRLALPAIIVLAVWKNFGFNMVVFLAGLQSIPARLYEAAHLDGAGPWQTFRAVTLPLLRPTLVFVTVITGIGYFQLFAEPYVMTQGGPAGATLSVVLLMYEEGFRWWNMGYGAAVAFLLFAVILAITLLQLTWQGRKLTGGSTMAEAGRGDRR